MLFDLRFNKFCFPYAYKIIKAGSELHRVSVNGHHIVESLFKGLGHALAEAVSLRGEGTVLSSKGVL